MPLFLLVVGLSPDSQRPVSRGAVEHKRRAAQAVGARAHRRVVFGRVCGGPYRRADARGGGADSRQQIRAGPIVYVMLLLCCVVLVLSRWDDIYWMYLSDLVLWCDGSVGRRPPIRRVCVFRRLQPCAGALLHSAHRVSGGTA
jgi:hypothetical protein